MGVVVHANFPDEVERSNGVATFTILPVRGQGAQAQPSGFVLEVNQQQGSWSVTNPPPGSNHLPEIDRVVQGPTDATPRIERVAASTLLPAGGQVLDDATLLAMFADARRVTGQWLLIVDAALSRSQRRSTLTLDLETRFVEPGWPALRSGLRLPARLVWKQARPLEPSAARIPENVARQPLPRDVLARARRVERRTCAGTSLTLDVVEAVTDPALFPDMGHAQMPFTSFVVVDFADGTRRSAVHTAFASVDHPVLDDERWSLALGIADDRQSTLRLSQVSVDVDGRVVVAGDGAVVTDDTVCSRALLFAAPADFLQSLLDASP
jgi:hypothetical protein